jgi:predicted nuclease of predicted toxin-antitoxin system
MKVLLDENIPHRLRPRLTGHDCYTVSFMKWRGVGNGDLLLRAASDGFDAIITKDTGIPYEQHVGSLPCAVVVLRARSNSFRDIEPLIPAILKVLADLKPRTVAVVE